MSNPQPPQHLVDAADPRCIQPDHLHRLAGTGEVHVVDVREPHEYQAGHVVGAINHPLSGFDPAKLPHGKPVVLVCGGGGRSLKATQAAHAAGRTDVIHYLPGTRGWIERGGPIEK